MAWYDTIVDNIASAVNNKVSGLVNTHNNSNSAHSTLFNQKSDKGHTHVVANVTDFDLESIEDNLRYEILCFTDNSLTTQQYNFNIDSIAYIIVNAYDIYGDSVNLPINTVLNVFTSDGVSTVEPAQRVTYNGHETNLYVYNCSVWGQCRFSIKTYSSFIYVDAMSKTDINTALNGKSATSHTHGTWTSQTIATYGTLYVNTAIRLCEFLYYRQNYKFTGTSEVTLASNAIPSTYRPKMNKYNIASALNIMGRVSPDGTIYARTSTANTYNINLSWMWHY